MPTSYKKEYNEFYMSPNNPVIVDVPKINYIAVSGVGNTIEDHGDFKTSISLLYAIAFTLRMSNQSNYKVDSYFENIVPSLEGLWWKAGSDSVDYTDREHLNWKCLIRLPDVVTSKDVELAIAEASKKNKIDYSKVKFLSFEEGLSVQCMHIGSYEEEPETIHSMEAFILENGYKSNFTKDKVHHEIYLSDPRSTDISKMKIVIRHPIIAISEVE